MIKEIAQFVDILPEHAFSKNIQLKEGVYIFLDIGEDNGKYTLNNTDSEGNLSDDDFKIWTSKSENSSFFEKCLFIQTNTLPVSPQKIFNPDKKIFNASCSPFALAFTKKNYKKYKNNPELLKGQLRDQYFKSAEKYLINEYHKSWFKLFKGFLVENLHSFLSNLQAYEDAKDKLTINIYFKKAEKSDFVITHDAYLRDKIFNKAQYNKIVDGKLLGISDSLSGFNNKKRFLKHQTGLSDLNFRISDSEAEKLWKFFKLQHNDQLPNPTPIFVDGNEMDYNKDLVSFYQDDRILTYSEIIKELIKKYQKQLQNYYLIFFQRGLKGSRIIDLDFVPVFHYRIDKNLDLVEVFKIGNKFNSIILNNVFDLQYHIFNKIFNNQLIKETKDGGIWLRFFDELEAKPQYRFTDDIVNLMYKYRKAIYDYVYKSKHQSITCLMFDEMMFTSIKDDIHHDEEFNRNYSIKEKLNIWFNLYDYFSGNKNRINMANKTLEISEKLRFVIKNDEEHIESDDEFAFAAGQLIWKILIQSKSSNRSHALLEPFLQKAESNEFKKAIARTFNTYKHEFVMYPQKYGFDKLMSEVMGYEPEEPNMKNLIYMILAGYFSESLFSKEKDNNQEQ
ncbi:MAG TPA: hypothetical protein VKA34_11590 [Balneolales bacterium]|nr:hypothetical protein [Balneolales bacterium]